MSDACQEIVSLDKAIRDILGVTMYPVQIWCDNQAAIDCTQKEGHHKLKNFDDDIETIKGTFSSLEAEKSENLIFFYGKTNKDRGLKFFYYLIYIKVFTKKIFFFV